MKTYIKSIVDDEFKDIITNPQAIKGNNWRETLAYLLSYVEEEAELNSLVHELAEELLNKKKDINAAIACFMISNSVETVIDLWKKRALFFIKKGNDRNESLFQLFEKCILFQKVCQSKSHITDFDLVATDVAEFLIGEDMKQLAMKYLEINANPKQSNVAYLKDRVFNSDTTRSLAKQFVRPTFPYQVEKIRVQMSQYAKAA